jgi:hypothetical protein
MARPKKKRGRPVKYPLPEPILDATPEEVAFVTLNAKPKRKWRFMEESGRKERRQRARSRPKELAD